MEPAVFERRVKIRVVEWDDPEFLVAVNQALEEAAIQASGIDGCAAAEIAQQVLRAAGYPAAVVSYWRTADEAHHQVAHWTVRRGDVDRASA